MARALRITFPGAFYYVTLRGNERKAVFKSKREGNWFSTLIARNVQNVSLSEI